MRRLLALCCLVALPIAACGGDGGGASDGDGGDGGATDGSAPITTLAPTTTFMPTCGPMPTVAAIVTAVGVPLNEGEVVETGTCQYNGLNDQTRTVTLGYLSDPADQASFNDLQMSLGAATSLADPTLPEAMLGADGTVFVTVNGAIYTVLSQLTGGTAAEQAPLSLAVLQTWLAAA